VDAYALRLLAKGTFLQALIDHFRFLRWHLVRDDGPAKAHGGYNKVLICRAASASMPGIACEIRS
jgi:hypothetical protein